ncbi:MAG: SH3 domain-containing protein [Eikenella sp.]|nr:SH3 domain-containing protein [Eikenella sp.]
MRWMFLSAALPAAVAAAADTPPAAIQTCHTVSNRAERYLATDHPDEAVHIRSRPSTGARVLLTCDNHGEADILGRHGAWYRVRLRMYGTESSRIVSGYVHSSQVSLRRRWHIRSASGQALTYLEADAGSPVQDRLPEGTPVVEFPANRRGDWRYIGYRTSDAGAADLYGYVHKSHLRRQPRMAR